MPNYNAEISAGSLMPLESRRIAVLLLTQPDEAAWRHAIEIENILQKNTPATVPRSGRSNLTPSGTDHIPSDALYSAIWLSRPI